MKKHLLIFAAALLACAAIFCACSDEAAGGGISRSSFTDLNWTREVDGETETIFFGSGGSFSYFCSCGNPVNDSDLCSGYTYDVSTGTITLRCESTVPGMITSIKVVSCDEETLVLNFGGDTRTFTRDDS